MCTLCGINFPKLTIDRFNLINPYQISIIVLLCSNTPHSTFFCAINSTVFSGWCDSDRNSWCLVTPDNCSVSVSRNFRPTEMFTQFIVHFCWHNHHPKYSLHSFTSLWFSGNQFMLIHEHWTVSPYPIAKRTEKLSHKSFIGMVCMRVFTGNVMRWTGRIIDFLNSKNNNFNVKLITYSLWQTMQWFREKQQQQNSVNRSVANQQCFDIFHLDMFRWLRDRKWYCSVNSVHSNVLAPSPLNFVFIKNHSQMISLARTRNKYHLHVKWQIF